MKYQFITKYGDGWSIILAYGDGKKEKCVFRNAVFETNNDELAQALQRCKYFNTDYWLNEKQQTVEDKYGEKTGLYNTLKEKKFQDLRSIALKAKGELGDPKLLFKKTKAQLIDYLLQNPERTEALM